MKRAAIMGLTLLALVGANAARVSSGDGLALTIAGDGRVRSVSVNGESWPTAEEPSGLLLRDVAADGKFAPADLRFHLTGGGSPVYYAFSNNRGVFKNR